MKTRTLRNCNIDVSALGFGCMGMSEFYGESDDTESLATLELAFELGVTMYDTADTYGIGHNEELIARFVANKRKDVVLATKCGIIREKGKYERQINSSPDFIRSACEASLKANTLKKANAVHPVAALQTEYSLWSREPEIELLNVCQQLDIAFVAYSPLGRGFLTGELTNTNKLSKDDFRVANPRFEKANLDRNTLLLKTVKTIANEHRCTLAQVALAWLLHQGPHIIPIPGTRRKHYLQENVKAINVALSAANLSELDRAFEQGAVSGERYTEEGMKGLNM